MATPSSVTHSQFCISHLLLAPELESRSFSRAKDLILAWQARSPLPSSHCCTPHLHLSCSGSWIQIFFQEQKIFCIIKLWQPPPWQDTSPPSVTVLHPSPSPSPCSGAKIQIYFRWPVQAVHPPARHLLRVILN